MAKSLLHMISNDVGQLACLYAKLHCLDRVYFGGFFIRGHPVTMHTITYSINFFSKVTGSASRSAATLALLFWRSAWALSILTRGNPGSGCWEAEGLLPSFSWPLASSGHPALEAPWPRLSWVSPLVRYAECVSLLTSLRHAWSCVCQGTAVGRVSGACRRVHGAPWGVSRADARLWKKLFVLSCLGMTGFTLCL